MKYLGLLLLGMVLGGALVIWLADVHIRETIDRRTKQLKEQWEKKSPTKKDKADPSCCEDKK